MICDGLLWRLLENRDGTRCTYQLVIPSSLRTEVLSDIHEGILGGHLGVDKSLGKLKEIFYWLGHYNDVKQWCATCVSCATRKSGGPTRTPYCCGVSFTVSGDGYIGPFTANK